MILMLVDGIAVSSFPLWVGCCSTAGRWSFLSGPAFDAEAVDQFQERDSQPVLIGQNLVCEAVFSFSGFVQQPGTARAEENIHDPPVVGARIS